MKHGAFGKFNADFDANFDVVVAGRGIAGATFALGLAQQGLRVLNTGPTQNAAQDKRVYALSNASVQLLQTLRIDKLLNQDLVPVHDMHVHGDAGGRLHFSAYEAGVNALAWMAQASDLLPALHHACELSRALRIGEDSVTNFQAHEDHVEVTLGEQQIEPNTKPHDAAQRSVKTYLLVAADGAASPLRAHAGITLKRQPYEQKGVVTRLRTEHPHNNAAYQWFSQESVLALLPLSGDEVSLVYAVSDAHAQRLLALPLKALSEEMTRASAGQLGQLEALEPAQAFALNYQRSSSPIAPRLALIGDAAHQMHPLAGQGLNAGLLDVQVLLDSIAARGAMRDPGDEKVLRRYQRQRAENLSLMLALTDQLQKGFQRPQTPWRVLRNLGMNALNEIQPLKNRLIRHAMN